MTLAAVSLPYYRYIMPYGLKKFVRFAAEVWNVDPEGKTDEEIAAEGLAAMESWMKQIGVAMNLGELGVTEDMLEDIVNAVIILDGGYKVLSRDEVTEILKSAI
jgi:alcohol dehydrogenase YqhD (iron-dependent ADH family)